MTTIKLKNGSGAPLAGDLVAGEPALDLTNKRLYTEDSGGTVIEVGTNPSTINIDAGTIDGTVIGGSTAAAGSFTTFTSTGIDDNAASTAITIDSSQNVGIGTSSIDFQASNRTVVHVEGSAGALLALEDTGAKSYLFQTGNDLLIENDTASGNMVFGTNASTERMRIDSSGQVRLSNTTPVWDTTFSSLVTKGGFTGSQSTSYLYSGQNVYYNGGFKYSTSSTATLYEQSFGNHIFYNAPSGTAGNAVSLTPAMTLDSSGNFMVGATSAFDSSSFCVDQSGLGQFRRDGTPLIIRRDGAYGNLIDFEQDGASAGSITSDAGSVGIGSGNVGLMFYDGGDRIIPRNGISTSDGVIDLGFSTDRFKDLYLSGGVYLGGTGSANLLDDYEEGSWTPNGNWSSSNAHYVKIGNLVHLSIDATADGTGGTSQITNLPFASEGTVGTGIYTSGVDWASGYTSPTFVVAGTTGYFRVVGDNQAFTSMGITASGVIHIAITYQTA